MKAIDIIAGASLLGIGYLVYMNYANKKKKCGCSKTTAVPPTGTTTAIATPSALVAGAVVKNAETSSEAVALSFVDGWKN